MPPSDTVKRLSPTTSARSIPGATGAMGSTKPLPAAPPGIGDGSEEAGCGWEMRPVSASVEPESFHTMAPENPSVTGYAPPPPPPGPGWGPAPVDRHRLRLPLCHGEHDGPGGRPVEQRVRVLLRRRPRSGEHVLRDELR